MKVVDAGRRTGGALGKVAALCLVLLLSGVMTLAAGGNRTAQAATGVLDTPRITRLIYPTFGNPAIVRAGSEFRVEFDPRAGSFSGNLPTMTDFEVSVRSTNEAYPYTGSLEVGSFGAGDSERWPELKSTESTDRSVYLVTVRVPESVPWHLYDLTVRAKMKSGSWYTDTQPHAFQSVQSFKNDFSFCQLSDIHVFGPEVSYPGSNQMERSGRPRYQGDTDPARKGAVYYQKAIAQLNVMRPDFCVFTGDYDFGQKYFTRDQGAPWGTTTEYEYEQLWFYEETLKLDVPVFMVVGNHDGYNEGGNGAGEDWLVNWQKLYGPTYYSFDYGDYHFLALNTMDWPGTSRNLTNWLNIILQPSKYKGQLRGGGDPWAAGATEQRFADIDESRFTGQLAWMRDDLKAHQSSRMRICAMHHDPWKDSGSGSMWDGSSGGWLEEILHGILNMGDGEGRLASIKLMRDYHVALEISGHDHSDNTGSVGWTGGGGSVLFCNTTSASFQSDGDSTDYPGYRRIWIEGGRVGSYSYREDLKLSYPLYAGTNVGGSTNLSMLATPAIESSLAPAPGSAQDVSCTISNHLGFSKKLGGARVEFPMPYLSGGRYYTVENGSLVQVWDQSGSSPPGHRVYDVATDVAAGASRTVRVRKAGVSDRTPPRATIKINHGAGTTTSRRVTIDVSASDGGAGVRDMMLSNSPDYSGGKWEPVSSGRSWTLAAGEAGKRAVYARFRDLAMPGNVTYTKTSIEYTPAPGDETGGPSRKWYFAEGCTRAGFEEWLSLQNSNDSETDVDISYMLENGENVPQSITIPPRSRYTVDVNSVVGPNRDVSALVDSALPIVAERPMYFDYRPNGAATPGPGWNGGHDVVGARNPLTAWYFAEGCTREYPDADFRTWLSMMNPGETPVTADVTYMLESGANKRQQVTIAPKSRKTVSVNQEAGPGNDVSTMVQASAPIVCERPMYFDYGGAWSDGHDVVGASGPALDWYLAEGTTHGGFATYVCIQNPGEADAAVVLEYMLDSGKVPDQPLRVPAMSRKTVLVNDWVGPARNVSIHVSSDEPVIVERPMYFSYSQGGATAGWDGGHCVMGASSPHARWYFAEGCTRAGFDEWISIQNPAGEQASVTVTYMLEDGTTDSTKLRVEPGSRATVMVNDEVKGEHDVSAIVSSDVPVIAERPMYFDYHGAWTGGSCVVGSGTD